MKRLIPNLLLICVCASVSFGVFDHEISDSYDFGITLNDESLLVTGAGALQIEARGTSYVEVQHTAPLEQYVGGIYTLDLDDFSTLNYYGGEMSAFIIYDDALATFSGGSVNYMSSYQFAWRWEGTCPSVLVPNPHITFVCDVDSVDLTGNLLTGNWLDGSGFSVTLVDQTGYDSVYSNINFIPEPATLLLFGVGGLILRKRRR